jgi:hypothetical protein
MGVAAYRMPAEERRRYALTGPPPPDWFAQMLPAPWITGHVISEGRKLAGASLVQLGGEDVPPDVPPATPPLVPAQRRSDVPADVPPPDNPTRPLPIPRPARQAGRHRAETTRDGQPVTSIGTRGRHRATATDPGTVAAREQMIIGLADAASYLGYDKPESFRRARTRNPIPGEGMTPDGRPCWTAQALRSWQSKRKIAGHRWHAAEPDDPASP